MLKVLLHKNRTLCCSLLSLPNGMAHWPVDTRKTKKKDTGYTSVELGQIGAALLVSRNNSLYWTNTVQSEQDTFKVLSNPAIKVFPATLPPPITLPQTSIVRQAELGANFLRTHFPDVDVPAELIREQLEDDSKQEKELQAFDPASGNLLDLTFSPLNHSMLLAFPMANLNHCLNLSPFVPSPNGQVFKPRASYSIKFETPIQQIVSSKSDPILAVRTFGSTSILEIGLANQLRRLFTVNSSDVANKPIVDIKPFVNSPESLFVDQSGAVHRGWLAAAGCEITLLLESSDYPDGFWRLALSDHPQCTFLTSSNHLRYIDNRMSPLQTIDVFELSGMKELLTSIEDTGDDSIIRLTSTEQIFWIDSRMPGKPLFAYRHKRQYDRTLESRTVFFDNAPLTLLTSKRNGLVTVYDVQKSNEMMTMKTRPSRISHSVPVVDGRFTGHTILEATGGRTALLSLTERGSIYSVDFGVSEVTEMQYEWSPEVQNLEEMSKGLRSDPGHFAAREKTEVNLRPVYDATFTSHLRQNWEKEEANANAVYELIEQVPSFWQSQDVTDHILTTYDLVFRSGEEPTDPSRADFLTGSIINSVRGRRAISQGRLSAEGIAKGAAWHCNLRPILQCLDCEVADDMKTLADNLERFTLLKHGQNAHSLRLEAEAKEQLALDLTLSSDVFSSRPVARQAVVDNSLETLTESLSLNAEPPAVDFQFLQPVSRRTGEDDDDLPIGVRLLLQDWDLGADPGKYVYKDPYNAQGVPFSTKQHNPDRRHIVQPPPVIAASKKTTPLIPPVVRARGAESQPVVLSASQPIVEHSHSSSFSQELMTNTQIVAGPFGSRAAMKKKPQKKRLGGF